MKLATANSVSMVYDAGSVYQANKMPMLAKSLGGVGVDVEDIMTVEEKGKLVQKLEECRVGGRNSEHPFHSIGIPLLPVHFRH